MHPCILCLALSLIARASDDDYPLATTTNLFFNDDDDSSDYIPLDELSTLPLPDSSYLLANEPSSSLFDFEDTSLSDFILSSDEDENDLSTCLLPPGSSSPAAAASRRTRARRGANSCSNNAVEGGPLFAVDAPPGRTAGAGTSTQRKTMEEVKTYWCAETSFPNFDNIPVCDAIFDSDALYQAPVHLSLDGAVPNQGFFNIMKGWPRNNVRYGILVHTGLATHIRSRDIVRHLFGVDGWKTKDPNSTPSPYDVIYPINSVASRNVHSSRKQKPFHCDSPFLSGGLVAQVHRTEPIMWH